MGVLRHITPLLLAIAFLSCSDESTTLSSQPEKPVDKPSISENDSKLFLNFGVSGDAVTRSRAATYSYEECENTVVHGQIFIYEGSSDGEEKNAKCVSKGLLYDPEETPYPSDLISKSLHYHNVELEEFDYDPVNKDYYALAVLNYNTALTLPRIGDTFGIWAYTAQSSNMLIDVNSYNQTKDADIRYKYITMTNATGEINHESGDFKPATLVKINSDDIQRGKFKENHQTSTIIYVQRNVAKVIAQPKQNLQGWEKLVPIGSNYKVQMNIYNWYLDVVNKVSYPVQKIEGLTWEKNFFHSGISTFDQVYWAIDPNYSDITLSKNTGDFDVSQKPWNNGAGSPLYCLENTFNIDNMLQGQTTRAVIRCTMEWWGSDGTQGSTGRYQQIKLPSDYFNDSSGKEANDSTEVTGYGNDFNIYGYFTIGKGEDTQIWDMMHIRKSLVDKAQEMGKNINAQNILIRAEEGGFYPLNQLLTIKEGETEISLTEEEWNILASALGLSDGTTEKIAFYKSRFTYYPVRIRHFYDTQTPWNGEYEVRSDGVKIAKYNESHLGRYGVARNHEYILTINSISGLGFPNQYPDINDEDTDDMPEENFIDITINIKSWGKRQSGFEL